MTSYLEEVEGKDFTDLAQNPDFQRDLVRYFSGSRYGMSREEMEELGPQGLAERFVEHMRWQSTNEYTALQDLSYVRDRENTSERELEAFGGLITAFDRAEGGGTGVLDGAWDYISAFASSPSTLATVATGGWGVGGKLAARAAGKSAQAMVRSQIADLVQRQVANRTIQDTVAGTVGRGAIRGAAASAVAEGAIGAAQGYMQGEIREETTGVDYGATDVLRDAAVSAAIGGGLGSAVRALDVRTQRRVVDELATRESLAQQARDQARDSANNRIQSASDEARQEAVDRSVEVATILSARDLGRRIDPRTGQRLQPLEQELVQQGETLRRELLGGTSTDLNLTTNLSVDTVRSVTAATLDIAEELEIRPGERITSAVARALRDTDAEGNTRLNVNRLEEIRTRYNLSREEMSYIWLADLSDAGKKLAEASFISRSIDRAQATQASRQVFDEVRNDIGTLAQGGLSTLDDQHAAQIVAETFKRGDILGKLYEGAQELDGLRIAMMTSQVGTTMANTITSSGNILLDMSNQFWKNFASVTYGRQVGDQVQRNWMGGTFSTLSGMTLTRDQARITRNLLEESFPLEYRNLFFEVGRAEAAMESQSGMAKVGRFFNTLNSATDSVFKQATFYSGLDRRLRDLNNPALGTNIQEFIARRVSLDTLPQNVVSGAIDDARRFTFQRSYYGDPSLFGQSAAFVERQHRRFPFFVSAGMGVPFPRYMANHLEHAIDYTPGVGLAAGGLNRLDNVMFGDTFKTGTDRFARQMTGASLVMMGAYAAAATNGEFDYDSLPFETGVADLSRTMGPYLLPFFLGDIAMRQHMGLPAPQNLPRELGEIIAGMGDFGFETAIIDAAVESINQGDITPSLQEVAGNIAATFMYPATIARDFQGMLNPASAPTPYTRDIMRGSEEEVSMRDEATFLETGDLHYFDTIAMRATRMLPDWDIMQYTQTLNSRNDIPMFSIFGGTVGSFNPISRQLGMTVTARPNEVRREMSRLNIREFDLYNRSTIENPAVDYIVQARLSETMNERFMLWSDSQRFPEYEGRTYNEIQDTQARRDLFEGFVTSEIRREAEETENLWKQMQNTRPRAAAGYVRNLYVLKENTIGEDDLYDRAVDRYTDGRFETAADFLSSAETVDEEIRIRQQIMVMADRFTVTRPRLDSQ